jgi:hypothetical protein
MQKRQLKINGAGGLGVALPLCCKFACGVAQSIGLVKTGPDLVSELNEAECLVSTHLSGYPALIYI